MRASVLLQVKSILCAFEPVLNQRPVIMISRVSHDLELRVLIFDSHAEDVRERTANVSLERATEAVTECARNLSSLKALLHPRVQDSHYRQCKPMNIGVIRYPHIVNTISKDSPYRIIIIAALTINAFPGRILGNRQSTVPSRATIPEVQTKPVPV
jgi:hypothetical protein